MTRPRVCPYCQQTTIGPCQHCKPRMDKQREEATKIRESRRGTAAERGYGHKWRVAREAWLKRTENHFCFYCEQLSPPRKTIANIIDHYVPHRGDQKLFWDRKNWRPACKRCHDQKTARGE